jgi:hypothetical protein
MSQFPPLPLSLNDHTNPPTQEELHEYAVKLVLDYCAEQVDKVEDGQPYRASRTIKQLRNHFNTLKADELGVKLKISFDRLIDDLIKQRRIIVTNGFVWVREGK